MVCSLIPCFFAISATGALSASRRIVTICSSVNRLFFMTSFSPWEAVHSPDRDVRLEVDPFRPFPHSLMRPSSKAVAVLAKPLILRAFRLVRWFGLRTSIRSLHHAVLR